MNSLGIITEKVLLNNLDVSENYAHYDEFIRRASSQEKKEIEEKLSNLTDSDYHISNLLNAIQEYEPTQLLKLLADPDMPYYALLAFKQGLLTDHQLGTFLLFWDACNHEGKNEMPKVDQCPLFGEFSPIYLELAFTTLDHSDLLSVRANRFLLTTEQRKEWVEELKKQPKSEQQFLVLSAPETKGRLGILTALNNTGFNVFWNLKTSQWMIPSIGMMQAYLNVKFGSNAVRIRPVIGSSSLKDLRSNFEVRDMACRFPGVALSDEADYYIAPGPSFALHDFYHCTMASFIPQEERKLIGVTRDIIFKTSKEVQDEAQARSLKHLCFVLIDMEHPAYTMPSLARDAYWVVLGVLFRRPALTNGALKELAAHSEAAKKVRPYVLIEKRVEELALRNICRKLIQSKMQIDPIEAFKKVKQSIKTFKKLILPPQKDTFIGQQLYALIEKLLENTVPMNLEFYDRLEAIYLDEKSVDPDFLDALKQRFLENDHPKGALEEFLPFLSQRNVIPLFRFSMEHLKQCGPLAQKCMQFIAEHFFDIVESDGLKAYVAEKPKQVTVLIKRIKESRQLKPLFKEAMTRFKSDGSCKVLDLFLESNLDLVDAYGFTLLDYAVEANQFNVAQLLVYRGADVNPLKGSKTIPSAFSALEVGNYQMYKFLLNNGFNTSILYRNQSLEEYLNVLMVDPSRFGGIVLHVKRESLNGGYSFNNEDFTLWVNAERAGKALDKDSSNEDIIAWSIRKD